MIDAHNHLQDPVLAGCRELWLPVLAELGIEAAVVNGTTEADWPEVERLGQEFPWVVPSYGLHPWYLDSRADRWEERLEKRLASGPGAVGEVGLDRWMRSPDFEAQREVLKIHLRLAAKYERPITIHCLRAWGALLEILAGMPRPSCGFLLHAYGGPVEMVPQFEGLGAYFSFSASFLASGKERKLEPFRSIPAERLLIETDAPAMPPPSERLAFRLPESDGPPLNHPGNLAVALQGLAEVRGAPAAEIARLTRDNFSRLFRPVLPDGFPGAAPEGRAGRSRSA